MNTKILTFFIGTYCLLSAMNSYAQPDAFNYQAVIRDANGDIIVNEFISLQFTIYYSQVGGEPLIMTYAETHDALTNEFGLVNVYIGSGQPSFGVFANLTFAQPEYYLKSEVDLGGGWVDMGTQQLMSVPFAKRADIANDLSYDVWRQGGNDDVNDSFDFIGTTTAEDLVFKTNNFENMRLDYNTGNVGVGTISPGFPQDGLGFTGRSIHLESDVDEEAVLILSQEGDAGAGTNITTLTHADGNFGLRNYSNDGHIQFSLGGNTAPVMKVIDGEFLVSTVDQTSLITKLRCATAATSRLVLQNDVSGTTSIDGAMIQLNEGNMSVLNLENGPLHLGGNGQIAMTCDANNEVGIGTQTPITQLQVEGGTDASLLLHGYMVLGDVASTNTVFDSNEIIARSNGNASDLFLNATGGGVVISSSASTTHDLLVNGTAAKPGGGSWTATSDERLKENVETYNLGLDEIMKIEPVTYHYIKITGHDTAVEHVGVIAQDIQKIAPEMVIESEMELVDGTKDQYLSVDPSAFTYMLINAIKEQQKQIEELKKEVAALKGE